MRQTHTCHIAHGIPGYEGYFEASTLGRVKSVARYQLAAWGGVRWKEEHILKPLPTHGGDDGWYYQVKLSFDGKREQPSLHRLIALTFVPNPHNYPQVNHIDGNKDNNRAENLEWCTGAENCQHRSHVLGKWVGRKKKPVICLDTGEIFESSHHAARALGVNPGGVFATCQGKQKMAGGMRFSFA